MSDSYGMPGPGGSLGKCALCGNVFLAEILLGKPVRAQNPTKSDIVQSIIADYKTSPRWCKAIQHLAERGELVNAPEDIGKLIREVQSDVAKEETDDIAWRLFEHFWPQISRGVIAGLPEWYKQRLADNLLGRADRQLEEVTQIVLGALNTTPADGQNPTDP